MGYDGAGMVSFNAVTYNRCRFLYWFGIALIKCNKISIIYKICRLWFKLQRV